MMTTMMVVVHTVNTLDLQQSGVPCGKTDLNSAAVEFADPGCIASD